MIPVLAQVAFICKAGSMEDGGVASYISSGDGRAEDDNGSGALPSTETSESDLGDTKVIFTASRRVRPKVDLGDKSVVFDAIGLVARDFDLDGIKSILSASRSVRHVRRDQRVRHDPGIRHDWYVRKDLTLDERRAIFRASRCLERDFNQEAIGGASIGEAAISGMIRNASPEMGTEQVAKIAQAIVAQLEAAALPARRRQRRREWKLFIISLVASALLSIPIGIWINSIS
ncbi:hypothetical protein AB0392_24395 [Nonomuraea angiospora]|uniref:hypothetical protein n=1 Tax=Nonomuraea angiospora TaxID=46172 RepID=UPI00344BC2BC